MATPYTDYGGGDDYGAWQQAYAQQQEEERRRIEEELRRQQEEEARLAAEAQAAQAAQQQQQPPPETFDRSQPPQTLGDLMQPPQQAHTYEMPAGPHTMPDGTVMAGGQPQTLGDLMQPPDQAQSYSGSVGAGGISGIPADLVNRKLAPVESLPAQPRDYSAQPLTGAELEAIGGNQHVPGASTYYGGSAFPMGTPSPDRKTSDMDLDQFNTEIRGSELYQQFIHDRGLWKPNGGVTEWSEQDRDAWKSLLEQHGVQVDGGMKIDNAGNINQKNTLGKKLAKVAIVAGGIGLMATGVGGPAGAAIIGATTGASTGAIDGGVKGALIGGALGAAGGYFAGGGNIPGIGGGAGGAGGAATTAATTTAAVAPTVAAAASPAAAAAGGGMLGGAMPQIVTGLAGLGTAYMGQRAQNKANERAAEASERGAAASERTITAQMEFEREQRERDRADLERRWQAEQDFGAKQWAAAEDERLFKRQIFLEDRAAKAAGSGGGGGYSYSGPSGPSEAELRKQQAIRNLDALLRQGTPGMPNSYVPATQGPTGRG